MTTIATDGLTIASDSRMIGEFIEQGNVEKIFRIGEQLVGVAGDYADCLKYIAWLQDGQRPSDRPKLSSFEALHISKSGVYWVGHGLQPVKMSKCAAAGSGGKFAIAAMLAGASPTKAVSIAMKLDPNSGGKVRTMRLK